MNKFNVDLICPKCKSSLKKMNASLVCDNNHCFDIAKEGYVNLLLANMKKTKMPGDDKVMIDARKNFLEKGYYKKLKDQIHDIISQNKSGVLLDAGCGTGYYTNGLNYKNLKIIGVDISKIAVQLASKLNRESTYIVSSIFSLPLKDNSVDIILNVFAPKPQEEFIRILNKDGIIIEVVPGEKHLKELKQSIYKEDYKFNKEKNAFDKFVISNTYRISYQETINNKEDVINLLKMTPYWYKGGEKYIGQFVSVSLNKITLDFIINVMEAK